MLWIRHCCGDTTEESNRPCSRWLVRGAHIGGWSGKGWAGVLQRLVKERGARVLTDHRVCVVVAKRI